MRVYLPDARSERIVVLDSVVMVGREGLELEPVRERLSPRAKS
jgi:hypothetical protein